MASTAEKVEKIEQIEKIDILEHKDGLTVDEVSVGSELLDTSQLDPAALFLSENRDLDTSHINISKLRHKIDRNIVPIMALCFFMQFLDKAIYNVGSCCDHSH